MKKILNILLIIFTFFIGYRFSKFQNNSLMNKLASLVQSEGLEIVIEDKFPIINPYGSYGSPYVFDFLFPFSSKNLQESTLFLCRRINKFYTKRGNESSSDLANGYDYFLVFVTKKKDENNYCIQDIIPNVGLMGMSLYYGDLGKDLSQFHYINNPKVSGPIEVKANCINGCVPIVISSESSMQILYYYQGAWLSYIEVDK